jgi:phosphoglycerate dehydrogenase-like enzyme
MKSFTIWANPFLSASAKELLIRSAVPHTLVLAESSGHVLDVGKLDGRLLQAEVVFGQPDPGAMIQSEKLRWLHISSAGYARYDTPEFWAALKKRNAVVTNSSSVYDAPCAEHVMAFMLADARQLYASYANQRETSGWPQNALRQNTRLLANQRVLIAGYGAIGRRLSELLAPFPVTVIGYRRTPRPDSRVREIGPGELAASLNEADHVVNTLPDNDETRHFFDADRLRQIKPGARYYSIGRGTTTEQHALMESLETGHLAAAYLDVTDPEPLPPNHPLWSTKNCYITPHTGGGHCDEFERIVEHFIENLRRFESQKDLVDRLA